ncbi:MAG: hypothetical protein HY078_00585 [Elusimicrobia bacterium]|nr:hypothetical protein [Elusimicrobiota bacterium]
MNPRILAACSVLLISRAEAANLPPTEVSLRDNTTGYVGVQFLDDEARAPGADTRFRYRRSDDRTPYIKIREWFLPESGIDPLHAKFEELFGEPYPTPEFKQFLPDSPFAEIRKLNDAFEFKALSGASSDVRSDGVAVSVSVRLPESREKELDVYINEDRILLSLVPEAEPGPWHLSKRREVALPIPPRADVRTASVDRRGDVVRISFHERRTRPPRTFIGGRSRYDDGTYR